ncbi:MAG: hypothetical protein OEZ34_16950, partial [Spirochaetia bacterium]|nr:hypothetical protein [Spirochaetia bacterium]
FNVKLPELNEVRQSLKTSAVTADPKDVLNMFEDIFNGQKPDLTPVKPDSLDLKFKISFDVVLKNKTKAALDFKKTEYDFYIGSEKLISGWTDKSAQNGKASIISVQNEFSSRSLAKSVIDAFKKGKGSYRFVGNTNLKLPDEYMQNTAEMKFDESGTFNLR